MEQKMDVEKQKRSDRKPPKPAELAERFDADFRGYINVNLTDKQKETFETWFEGGSFWDMFNFQVGDGVNIAVKVDPKGSGFLASATQRKTTSPNAGLVVTARGRDASVALGRVVFILAYLSHSTRWEDVQPVADPDRW